MLNFTYELQCKVQVSSKDWEKSRLMTVERILDVGTSFSGFNENIKLV
jgi:hypothetical protein